MSECKDIIYLDNAATSWPKPPEVMEAINRFMAKEAANPGRAGHRMAVAAERMINGVRKQLADLIGGTDPDRLVFTLNCTDALNIALKGILRQGDHVITTHLEHNSVSRPLQTMADAGFITISKVSFSPSTGLIDPDDIRKFITPKTRLIVMTHASNVLGTIQPVAAVGALARERNVLFLLDAAQTIGVVPINVQKQFIDLLAFPGHKSLLGPPGTGGLYVNTTVKIDDLQAFREGGTGGDSSSPVQPRLFPYYLEGGTPNTAGIAGLGAAVEFVTKHGIEKTLRHEQSMVQKIIDGIVSNQRFKIYGPATASARVGTVSFNIEGYTSQEAGSVLDESFSIAVRPGLHCAPYAHRAIGTLPEGTLRVSPGHFTTISQIENLLKALQQMAS